MERFGVTFGSSTGSVLSPNKLLITPAYIVFLTKSCKSPSPKIKIYNFKSQKRKLLIKENTIAEMMVSHTLLMLHFKGDNSKKLKW